MATMYSPALASIPGSVSGERSSLLQEAPGSILSKRKKPLLSADTSAPSKPVLIRAGLSVSPGLTYACPQLSSPIISPMI